MAIVTFLHISLALLRPGKPNNRLIRLLSTVVESDHIGAHNKSEQNV